MVPTLEDAWRLPLRFRPVYRAYRFGGQALSRWGKEDLPPGGAAESWEVSPYPASPSVVAEGPARGLDLVELATRWGSRLGRTGQGRDGFPFLLKILDVAGPLPVHVHPSDDQAKGLEGPDPGKDEAWYILEAAPDAAVWLGFDRPLSDAELREGAREGRLTEVMRRFPVAAGDVVFVPARTPHAAWGVVFLEIQEVSDRSLFAEPVDVWGRPFGDRLAAEVERFMAVVERGPGAAHPQRPERLREGVWTLGRHRHFAWELWRLAPGERRPLPPLAVGQSWTGLEGTGQLTGPAGGAPLTRGLSLALAAAAGQEDWHLEAGPQGLTAVRGLGPAAGD